MSFALSGAIVVGAELVSIYLAWLRLKRTSQTTFTPSPEGWGPNPDDEKWEAEADELPHKSLASVREGAKNWAASIGALLGVGGTVAFVKGQDTFAKLSTSQGNFAFWLTLTAAILAATAIALATFAAQGTVHSYDDLDGWRLKELARTRGKTALAQLQWSRVLTLLAAVAVAVGISIAWKAGIASEPSADGAKAIARTDDGRLRCGVLTSTADGQLSLSVTGKSLPVDAESVASVDACPAAGGN